MNQEVFVEKFMSRIQDIKETLRNNEWPLEVLLERVKTGQGQLATFSFRHEEQCMISNELFELVIKIEHRIWQKEESVRLAALLDGINF
jgi:hypothetical protein